ncbi:hypothetical protein FIU95_07285 [Microbulbifer sp. THAF38]|nr:hypothetical protein FIU95_07285 [Microbulbifer sp. THAF38]
MGLSERSALLSYGSCFRPATDVVSNCSNYLLVKERNNSNFPLEGKTLETHQMAEVWDVHRGLLGNGALIRVFALLSNAIYQALPLRLAST